MKPFGYVLSAVLALACTTYLVHAQTNVGLSIQLYAGVTVTGEVGTVYSIE